MRGGGVAGAVLRAAATVSGKGAAGLPLAKESPKRILVNNKEYDVDRFTNVTPKILSHLNRNLHVSGEHPLSLVRKSIVQYFYNSYVNVRGNPIFSVYDRLNPVVSVEQNFDSLLIPEGHPSRARSDCYYINERTLLRAHTTAHQADLIKAGLDNFIIIGDVYRRDEIDSTHYPVFHQIDAVRSQTKDQLFPDRADLDIFERDYQPIAYKLKEYCPLEEQSALRHTGIESSKQPCHTLEAVKVMEYQLKHALVGMVKHLFGESIDYRWVDAYFPFTRPSWELEIFYEEKWMEVLGCGIVKNEILLQAGSKNTIAYAFGLGLERLAMALYDIPDIRLFWSRDSGFLSQFENVEPGRILKYKPVSVYPQCSNDISFWLPDDMGKGDFSNNDFYDLVREIGDNIVEQVHLIDAFLHPKTQKTSLCFRIVYRHMERTLTQEEVNRVHKKIEDAARDIFKVTIR